MTQPSLPPVSRGDRWFSISLVAVLVLFAVGLTVVLVLEDRSLPSPPAVSPPADRPPSPPKCVPTPGGPS